MTAPSPTVSYQGLGVVPADLLNTFVQGVINYAQLRTFAALSNMMVYAQGAVAPGDGGQGVFWYNSTSTAPDNNSTVIVPTGNTTGAWLALASGTFPTIAVSGAASIAGPLTLGSALSVAGVATFASDVLCSGTGELQLPAGTTAQRSSSPSVSMIRYNTTTGQYEGYGAAGWAPLAGTSSITPGAITGLLPSSIAGTSTTASLTVSSGSAADSTVAAVLSLASAASWSVTNGNAINGYQGGTTLPNSATIHMFVCTGSAGTGLFASTSLTPTLPAGYTAYYRRIFSFTTTSGGSPNAYVGDEVEGGALCAYLTSPAGDINGATLSTGSRTLYSMSVPTLIKVAWQGMVTISGTGVVLVTSPDETDSTPNSSALGDIQGFASYLLTAVNRRITTTNTGGQIGIRGSAAVTAYAYTTGWIDFRRS